LREKSAKRKDCTCDLEKVQKGFVKLPVTINVAKALSITVPSRLFHSLMGFQKLKSLVQIYL
jgi:hypothetical protein